MESLNEIERGQLCQATIESLYEATGGLRQFPSLLKKIIRSEAWRRRVSRGKVIELGSLRELITEKPLSGWGEDPDKIAAVIKDDAEALAMFRKAMKCQGKRTDLRSNPTEVEVKQDRGKAYTLSRLEREAPQLFQDVCDGKLSANAAAIQAGIRKPPPSHAEKCVASFRKTDKRLETLRTIVNELEAHEVQVLKQMLEDHHAITN